MRNNVPSKRAKLDPSYSHKEQNSCLCLNTLTRAQYFNFLIRESPTTVSHSVPSCYKAETQVTLNNTTSDVLGINVQKFFLPTSFVPFYLFELPPQPKVEDNRFRTNIKILWYTPEGQPIGEEYIYFTPVHNSPNPPATINPDGTYSYKWDDPYFYVVSPTHLLDTLNDSFIEHNCNIYFYEGLLRMDYHRYDEEWNEHMADIPHFPVELYNILGAGFGIEYDQDEKYFTHKRNGFSSGAEMDGTSIMQTHATLENATICKQIIFTLNGADIKSEFFPNTDDGDIYENKNRIPIFASYFPISTQMGDTQSNVIYTANTERFGTVALERVNDDSGFSFYRTTIGFKWVDSNGKIHDLYIHKNDSAWIKIGIHTL